MTDKTNFLPYTKAPFWNKEFKKESLYYAGYLRNIFTPYFKKEVNKNKDTKISNFLYPKPQIHLQNIQNLKHKYHYKVHPSFLYFDIQKFYPTIDQQMLEKQILKIYLKSRGARNLDKLNLEELRKHHKLTRYFKKFLKFLTIYFDYLPVSGKWLLLSSSLTPVLAEIYLWDLFINIPTHTFHRNDDFIIFTRYRKDSEKIFKNNIIPKLTQLKIIPNLAKTNGGKLFGNDILSYIGFDLRKWPSISIQEKRVKEYLKKVKKIFFAQPHQKLKNKIKRLRNLQHWFYYYYRWISKKQFWQKLNGKTRDIVRQYLLLYKKNWKKRFLISNISLHHLGIVDFTILK